jgi:hypothetical protein
LKYRFQHFALGACALAILSTTDLARADSTYAPAGNVTATGPSVDQYVYGEIDDANGNPIDYTVFDAGNRAVGPVVFTFANPDGSPLSVAGFGTTLYGSLDYESADFTGTVVALNGADQVLGSETYTADDYQAFAGIANLDGAADIASVVISSDDNEFEFGTVGVAPAVPEPGTFALVLCALAAAALRGVDIWYGKRAFKRKRGLE